MLRARSIRPATGIGPVQRRAAAALAVLLLLVACERRTTAGEEGAAPPAPVAPRPSEGCTRPSIATGRRIEKTITVAGTERRYVLDVPETLQPGDPAALLF